MNHNACPAPDELVSFADADLPPERLERIEKHLELCSACAKSTMALSQMIRDIAAPLPGAKSDVREHVQDVMRRLDTPIQSVQPRRWAAWAGGALAAAAAFALFTLHRAEPEGRFQARSTGVAASLSRDVGVELYAGGAHLRALSPGDRITRDTPLTAGFRNLSRRPAYVLLFALDNAQQVHWIAPEFTVRGTDPEAAAIAPHPEQRLLPSSVVFDDLAPGALRIVAIITTEPLRLSAVETLSSRDLDGAELVQRFAGAELRQFMLEVSPTQAP